MDSGALRVLTGIGDTYALAGDYEAARRAYGRLLAASPSAPDSVDALLRIAEAFTFAGDIARAEATLEPGVELARARADAALEYAVLSRINALQRWNNQLDEAEQSLTAMAGIGAHASLPEATRRANALRSLQLAAMVAAKRGDEASATRKAAAYMEGRANEGLPPQREMTLGLIATYLGQHVDAIAFLERAPETERYSYLQYWLGVAHEALGHRDAALVYFERVANWRALTPVDRLQLPLVRDLARRRLLSQR